jgi:hypothetical protein
MSNTPTELQEYLDAQDALDNREYAGINAEDYFVLMRRRNSARDRLDAVLSAIALNAPAGAAKARFDALAPIEDCSPIERLRLFCSLAMSGQDWLDSESFFAALAPAPQRDAPAGEMQQWSVSGDGRTLIANSFQHDVKITLDGDFALAKDRIAYADDIARRLSSPPPSAQPAAEPVPVGQVNHMENDVPVVRWFPSAKSVRTGDLIYTNPQAQPSPEVKS